MANPGTEMTIVYDGECPFCRNYVRLMALRKAVGAVDLVDARSGAPAARRLVDLGYDLNEGMAAIYGGTVYYGSDAVVLISTLSRERGAAARFLAALLRDPARAKLLYPAMKLGRRVVLRLLGRSEIALERSA